MDLHFHRHAYRSSQVFQGSLDQPLHVERVSFNSVFGDDLLFGECKGHVGVWRHEVRGNAAEKLEVAILQHEKPLVIGLESSYLFPKHIGPESFSDINHDFHLSLWDLVGVLGHDIDDAAAESNA